MIFLVTKTSTSMPPTSSAGWRPYTNSSPPLRGSATRPAREADPGTRQVRNLFGGVGPLQLSVVTPVLERQAGLGLAAFRAKHLVREHEVAITGRHRLP
jgi:hypothetical protein